MQFTSMAFACFLAIAFFLYWALPDKCRMPLLLAVSYGFYMTFSPVCVLLLIGVSALVFLAAPHCGKKPVFAAAVLALVFLLVFFKCAGLFEGAGVTLMMPVGISFYMFKAVSYLADVRTGKTEAEKNPLYVALYLAFFADIVSGPINRAELLIPQFRQPKRFSYDGAVMGMRMILWGLFQKMLIADTLARYVDPVFSLPGAYMGITYLVAAVFYTIEIYCDFAGYSCMAVGIAGLFGLRSVQNFKSPYFAADIREFWERWHISLSTWLRDYVYIPLGGSRKGKGRTYVNLMLTFLVSGIWHGVSLTFLVWGALHGLYQVICRICRSMSKKRMPRPLGIVVTFTAVSFAWIFFRAESLSDAFIMIRYMFYNVSPMLAYRKLGMNQLDFWMLVCSMGLLAAYDYASLKTDVLQALDKLKLPFRFGLYLLMAAVILAFHIHNGASQQFIYFKF